MTSISTDSQIHSTKITDNQLVVQYYGKKIQKLLFYFKIFLHCTGSIQFMTNHFKQPFTVMKDLKKVIYNLSSDYGYYTTPFVT